MILFAFLCIAIGVWPEPLYALLPYAVNYEPYTAPTSLTQLQLLLFSGLAFFVMLPYLKRTLTITLDTDWVWRRLLFGAARTSISAYRVGADALAAAASSLGQRSVDAIARMRARDGVLRRGGSTASMGVWVMVMLIAHLLLYHVF